MLKNYIVPCALMAVVIASPTLAATVVGTTAATFVNPQPVTATYTGVGTSSVTWGDDGGDRNYPPNRMTFSAGSPFSSVTGQSFKVGSISYFNGSTLAGTEITRLGLNLAINFSDPALGTINNLFNMNVITTDNDGDANHNADYVDFPSMTSSKAFSIDGQTYTFKLLGFSNVVGDGFLSSTASQFHVREGGTASADLYGMVTAAAVPEPASWGMMIVGFGAIGGALRRRKSKLNFA